MKTSAMTESKSIWRSRGFRDAIAMEARSDLAARVSEFAIDKWIEEDDADLRLYMPVSIDQYSNINYLFLISAERRFKRK